MYMHRVHSASLVRSGDDHCQVEEGLLSYHSTAKAELGRRAAMLSHKASFDSPPVYMDKTLYTPPTHDPYLPPPPLSCRSDQHTKPAAPSPP